MAHNWTCETHEATNRRQITTKAVSNDNSKQHLASKETHGNQAASKQPPRQCQIDNVDCKWPTGKQMNTNEPTNDYQRSVKWSPQPCAKIRRKKIKDSTHPCGIKLRVQMTTGQHGNARQQMYQQMANKPVPNEQCRRRLARKNGTKETPNNRQSGVKWQL